MSKESFKSRLRDLQLLANFIEFDKFNANQKWGYVSSCKVLRTVGRQAAELDLLITNNKIEVHDFTVDDSGTTRCWALREMTIGDVHSDASCVFQGVGEGKCRQGTAVLKAATASLKYAIQSMSLMAWDENDPELNMYADESDANNKKVSQALNKAKTKKSKNWRNNDGDASF